MADAQALKSQIERVALQLIDGWGAHADPVACVSGLTPQLAAQRPPGFTRSVCELLAHLNFWMEYDLQRMRGVPMPYPKHAAESWATFESITEADWKQMVRRFRELLDELRTVCRSDMNAWMKQAPATHASHERNASTVGAMIFQALTHNSYHLGQIVDVRRALGAWPPKDGGDTTW